MSVSRLDYEYDIFISYRRMDEDWIRWTKENFVRPLRSLLRPALGNVKIFVDDQIETGSSWPDYLARALAHSRLLIPVLCRDYFNSDWCRLELALMHQRAMNNPANMILPFIIDDGDCFPPEIQVIQSWQIHDFANPWMPINSPKQYEFAEHLKGCCPRIQTALATVPQFDPAWENIALAQFSNLFKINIQAQTSLPGLSLSSPLQLP
ncbi:MAG: toll/interleukin-1 receptor domain-containing protein [Proteobacteria bacterium]|nr:toll/interleukin-1 receptor domain-containing protein [Pseudomonadota bacterium]